MFIKRVSSNQTKKRALGPKCHFTDPITFRTRKEMEGISAPPPPPPPPNRIHSLGGCLISPFHLNLFSPHFIFIALFERERKRQDLSFRIEIGLKDPQAVKVPLFYLRGLSFSPKVGHCVFIG
ncbi:hypothetical protein CEXT_588141 [Caerostris extrusa]|uniref:Uncharacterized protein n=1 Tax=Caerostris extrusa TaxID=172846 RepID=A0AAV4XEB0_CAEEX|nr:hypothetical protein CEXT_588141 [Caerostris extrusa]